jgi:hypothetical protein
MSVRAARRGYVPGMSKAFTDEEADDLPLIVRPRAPLPPGVPNYVTARGLQAAVLVVMPVLDHGRHPAGNFSTRLETVVLTRAGCLERASRIVAIGPTRVSTNGVEASSGSFHFLFGLISYGRPTARTRHLAGRAGAFLARQSPRRSAAVHRACTLSRQRRLSALTRSAVAQSRKEVRRD